ncbi:signal recognition particle-docking protein FtsY, partial [Thalassococcus lentus]|nr:signal recognition particle-docking protein FtsY [Thalassococcus lentus]
MSFFGKLKNRLFKSSSKLDEGLDAIVQDGGTEEPEAEAAEQPDAPEQALTQSPEVDPLP